MDRRNSKVEIVACHYSRTVSEQENWVISMWTISVSSFKIKISLYFFVWKIFSFLIKFEKIGSELQNLWK